MGGFGWAWVWVCGRVSHACMHMHAYACMHTHTHACCKHVVKMINMDASMGVAICNFYICIHVCACMCMYVGTPTCPQTPPTHLSPPKSHREPKTPKFKSWTNRDNSILIEDSLPLNTPELIWTIVVHPRYLPPTCPTPPQGEETQIRRITITLERIKIIQFCLKIWDP